MIALRLVCVGRLKEKFYQEACREYEKRLGAYCRLEIRELPEETGRPDGLRREACRIQGAILPGSRVVAMCIEGEMASSEDLARRLAGWQAQGVSRVTVIVGSSEGLEDVYKRQTRALGAPARAQRSGSGGRASSRAAGGCRRPSRAIHLPERV